MENENKDGQEVQKTPEGDPKPEEGGEETPENKEDNELTPEELVDLKKRADASSQNFERLKELEKENKKLKSEPKEETPKETPKDLSSKDLYSLMSAKVPQEDVDEVVDYAKFKGISVEEALKSDVIKTTLDTNAEHRKTANASNTDPSRPSSKKLSGAEIQKEADKGNMPEKGSEEAEELFWQRRGGRRE